MALGYFMSAFVPSGARPQGALPVPPLQYFKLPSAGKNKLLRGSQGKGGEEKLPAEGEGRQDRWDGSLISCFCTTAFLFIFFFKTLTLCKDADFMQVSPIGSSKIHLSHEHFHP